jgi:hypothetical protein
VRKNSLAHGNAKPTKEEEAEAEKSVWITVILKAKTTAHKNGIQDMFVQSDVSLMSQFNTSMETGIMHNTPSPSPRVDTQGV